MERSTRCARYRRIPPRTCSYSTGCCVVIVRNLISLPNSLLDLDKTIPALFTYRCRYHNLVPVEGVSSHTSAFSVYDAGCHQRQYETSKKPNERKCAHTEIQAHVEVDIRPSKTSMERRRTRSLETNEIEIEEMRNMTKKVSRRF